jgi:ParB family transcriptional regulator, chromosome partitioning protein
LNKPEEFSMSREVKYYDPTTLVIVGLDRDEESSPLNDERSEWAVDEAMVRNIMVYGIQQPVLIRKEAGTTYVVDGRQRVKAARVAAQRQDESGEFATKVPCIEVTGDDSRVTGIMISTNEIRQDDDVLTKAAKASRLFDMVGDKEEVALAFGKSTKTIDNWTKLLAADPAVHAAIREGKISASVGITLSSKSRQEQIVALDQILEGANSPATSNSETKPKAPKAPSSSSSSSSTKEHPGVKKGWLRKALKTDAFNQLPIEEQETLQWILSGSAPKGHWVDTFTFEADTEIEGS